MGQVKRAIYLHMLLVAMFDVGENYTEWNWNVILNKNIITIALYLHITYY